MNVGEGTREREVRERDTENNERQKEKRERETETETDRQRQRVGDRHREKKSYRKRGGREARLTASSPDSCRVAATRVLAAVRTGAVGTRWA